MHFICYKPPLTCAENYTIWLRRFKDKSKNVRLPHFFGPRCIYRPASRAVNKFTRTTVDGEDCGARHDSPD